MKTYGDYCEHCCFYYDRKPGAISAIISLNGPNGAGSGIQHEKNPISRSANAFLDKPKIVDRIRKHSAPEDLKTDLNRTQVIASTQSRVSRAPKQCRKCGFMNQFFALDC